MKKTSYWKKTSVVVFSLVFISSLFLANWLESVSSKSPEYIPFWMGLAILFIFYVIPITVVSGLIGLVVDIVVKKTRNK